MSSVSLIASARAAGRTLLNEVEAKRLLADADIPVTEAHLARTRAEAERLAAAIGYPVVLKVVSDDIPHKSDVGGVQLNLSDRDAVGAAYDRILDTVRARRPDARIDGVSVQRQASPGVEVIVGLTTDPQFGPVVMFGLGGVLVEVLQDVAFRVVPLTARDAREMIREVKGFALLQGYRGAPPADLGALEALLLKVSALAQRHPEIAELDLNPVFAYSNGVLAVDARVVLAADTGGNL